MTNADVVAGLSANHASYHCTIITSFIPATAPIYLNQFEKLKRHLKREKVQVLHLMNWKGHLAARDVRRLRQHWQLSYRENSAVLLDKRLQLLQRYEKGFDLVDALMRCKESISN